MHVLVVGGGDSALEAATSIAEEPGTTVTLSYRSAAFGLSGDSLLIHENK
jgi:cation diffusion facilitator CzcD-associated flavoprotein CzcO